MRPGTESKGGEWGWKRLRTRPDGGSNWGVELVIGLEGRQGVRLGGSIWRVRLGDQTGGRMGGSDRGSDEVGGVKRGGW